MLSTVRRMTAVVAAIALTVTVAPAALARPVDPAPRNLDPKDAVDRLDPLVPGTLTVSSSAAGSWTVGNYSVTLDATTGLLAVKDTSLNADVWSNVAGQAFIVGSMSQLKVYEDQGAFYPEVKRSLTLSDQSIASAKTGPGTVTFSGSIAKGKANGTTWSMTLGTAKLDDTVDALTVDVTTGTIGKKPLSSVLFVQGLAPNEAVHGFGSQYRAYDLSGTLFPIMVREQGVGRGEQPISNTVNVVEPGGAGTLANTYAAWPTWLTSGSHAGRVIGAGEYAFGTVDLRSGSALNIEMRSPRVQFHLVAGSSPADALKRRDAGRTIPGTADWTSRGAILGLQGGTTAVREKLQKVLDAGGEVSAVWLQDWVGRRTTSFGDRLWWTWQLDREWYPGWETLVDDLDKQGIKVLTYVNPMLVDPATKKPKPTRNLFKEASSKGYFVKTSKGKPYLQDQGQFMAALIDLTNPKARSWFIDVIANDVLGGKVAGMMADFGEGLPYDAVLQGGSGAQLHNQYPRLWADTVRAACDKAGKPDCAAWMRSGTQASAEDAPMFWGGDQMVSFAVEDGMPSALYGIHASGAAGWPLMHSDVGGYTSVAVVNYVRGPELIGRWAQMEAFGTFMRTHEGNQPSRNLQVYTDDTQASAFAYGTRIYAALGDYRRIVIAEAVDTGMPAMRHPSLVYPGTKAADQDNTFFLGDHLFVAPVMAAGQRTVEVTLPPGTWVHALTGEELPGDTTQTIAAPLDQATAFVLKGDPVGEQIRTALKAAGVAR
ncbi:MAG: alpha-glucosidase [Actinomycetota bacterium]